MDGGMDAVAADRLLAVALGGDERAGRDLTAGLLADEVRPGVVDHVLDRLAAEAARSPTGPALDLLARQLYHQPFLRSEIRRYLMNDDQADDALQDTILAVVGGLSRFRGESLLRTWATSIARNRAIATLRRRRERPTDGEDLSVDVGEAVRFSSTLATREDLRDAVRQLPPMFADVVRLRDLERLPYAEIADRLGIELNTVRSRLARGRARLAATMTATA